MITLKIDNDEQTTGDQVTYLKSVIDRLDHGFTSGTNWEVTGSEEDEIKVGDRVFIEQAWEDEAGNYHDAFAEVIGKEDDGELRLKFDDKRVDDFYGNGAVGAGFGTETKVEKV